jgi:hypothetical protein
MDRTQLGGALAALLLLAAAEVPTSVVGAPTAIWTRRRHGLSL